MIPILSPNFKFKLFFMGPGFSILIPFPIHFSRNLNSHMISIGFSKTHGLQDFLGFNYFWDQLPKTLQKKLCEVYCSTIEKKDKFFPPKLDTLQKRVDCRKAIVATLILLLMNGLTTNMHHNKNKRIYTNFFHCQEAFGFN